MSLENFQYRLHTSILEIFKSQFPGCYEPEVMYEKGWFEQDYYFNLNVFGHIVKVVVYVHIDVFDFNAKPDIARDLQYTVTRQMGFRSPYKKESWQRKQLTSTMLFDVNEDKTFNCINFVYKPQEGMSLMQEIRQFAADVALNLSGPYLLYIAQMNGLTN